MIIILNWIFLFLWIFKWSYLAGINSFLVLIIQSWRCLIRCWIDFIILILRIFVLIIDFRNGLLLILSIWVYVLALIVAIVCFLWKNLLLFISFYIIRVLLILIIFFLFVIRFIKISFYMLRKFWLASFFSRFYFLKFINRFFVFWILIRIFLLPWQRMILS